MGLGALQPGHLIVVLVIVLLIFGPGKLGGLGKALGDGIKELKKGADIDSGQDHSPSSTATPASTAATAVATPPTAASRPCPSCRSAVPVGDKFCGSCGASTAPTARSA